MHLSAHRTELSNLGKLLLAGVIGGVLAAVTVLPAAAVVAFSVNHSAIDYEDLPEVLRNPTISQASELYANDGTTLITTFYDENRRDIPLDQVPKVLQDAVIAAEDSRFYEHHGVDLVGVIRANPGRTTATAPGASPTPIPRGWTATAPCGTGSAAR